MALSQYYWLGVIQGCILVGLHWLGRRETKVYRFDEGGSLKARFPILMKKWFSMSVELQHRSRLLNKRIDAAMSEIDADFIANLPDQIPADLRFDYERGCSETKRSFLGKPN